jgi:hypothetical protein
MGIAVHTARIEEGAMSHFACGVRAIAVAAVAVAFSTAAWADDFVTECEFNNRDRGSDAERLCNCMSEKVAGPVRADAIEAMRKMNASIRVGGAPLDPSTLPASQMNGLDAVVAAQATCM